MIQTHLHLIATIKTQKSQLIFNLMKYIVTMYQGGQTFTEEVYANDVKEAKETAKVRNPSCKVIGANASFR